MRRTTWAVLLFVGTTMPLFADEPAASLLDPPMLPYMQLDPTAGAVPCEDTRTPALDQVGPPAVPWQTVWGLAGVHVIPDGPKFAPNGEEYHPNFSLDLDFNLWLWRSQGLYLFADARFWGEKPESSVTNARDGALGTSKRQFDLTGGAAWNYYGAWEARAFGYSYNNLNRGTDPVAPNGFNDGFGVENRYYLSPEYAKLGQTGFDVARATFLSIGYYPSKDMVGNDGRTFTPGLFLRAYLTYGFWDWPCYAFSDTTYIAESSSRAKLLLFDLGLAARPIPICRQCEIRLGVESTADFEVRDVLNLWYVSIRYIF
jgi:hypothetical protein